MTRAGNPGSDLCGEWIGV